MKIRPFRFLLLVLLSFVTAHLYLTAHASEDAVEIDRARVFPVQRNTAVIHGAGKDATDAKCRPSI
ncbi:hypothetical protein IC571_08370 [Polynucleobacter sp. MWH-UH2A]|nr:hypothetical protein IC571_08370 [Polynucleobacter sp. MWH-UH2A]